MILSAEVHVAAPVREKNIRDLDDERQSVYR